MNKEHFKTVLIALLFVVSLTLTQQLWIVLPLGETISTSSSSNLENINIDVTDILSPQSFVLSFGGDNHTVFFAEPYEIWNITKSEDKEKIWIWKTVRSSLKNYFSGNIEFEIVGKEQWDNINNFKSLRLDFAYPIPTSSFIKILSSGTKIVDQNISNMDSLLIPTIDSEKNNIYIGNSKESFYLRVRGIEANNNIGKLIDNIAKTGEGKLYPSYYPLNYYISVDSKILTPIFEDIRIPAFTASNQVETTDDAQIKSFANKFFGDKLDFVKEIKETSGTIIYMYGYGEKALKINANGLLEYIEQKNKNEEANSLSFVDSLKTSVKFVKEYIGWPVNAENAYLSYYEPIIKDNKKGYRFGFNYRLKGLPVVIPNTGRKGAIEVEVIGDQVTYYKRIIKMIDEEKTIDRPIPFIIEALDFDAFRMDYMKNKGLDVTQINNAELIKLVRSIGLVYYYDDTKDELIPVWEIVLDDMTYYFDLYEGDIIHSYKI